MSKSEFKRTVSRLSRLGSQPDPIGDLIGDLKGVMETPPPKLHKASEVLLKSGVVCWNYQDELVILHQNKVTGQISLPQCACKWVSKSEVSMPVLESFDATAERIANYQLGFESEIVRYNPEESRQPYVARSGIPLRMKTPFMFQSEASLGNELDVTAWFLASFDSKNQILWGSSRLRASDRGEDWGICVYPTDTAIQILTEPDRSILRKAVDARDYNVDIGD